LILLPLAKVCWASESFSVWRLLVYSGRIFRLTDKNLALWLTVAAMSDSILLEKHFHITVVEPPGVKGLSYSLIGDCV